MLEKSKAGIYSQFEVQRGLPIQMLVKYFTQTGELWQLNADIRAMVQHRQLNLLQDFSHLGTFDVIFCRNVLIYFDQDTKAGIFERLVKDARTRRRAGCWARPNPWSGYPTPSGPIRSGAGSTARTPTGRRAPASAAMPQALKVVAVGALSLLQDRVRQEPRRIAGDRILVLADR